LVCIVDARRGLLVDARRGLVCIVDARRGLLVDARRGLVCIVDARRGLACIVEEQEKCFGKDLVVVADSCWLFYLL